MGYKISLDCFVEANRSLGSQYNKLSLLMALRHRPILFEIKSV